MITVRTRGRSTLAGAKANACLAETMRHGGLDVRRFDNFSVSFGGESLTAVNDGVKRIRSGDWPVLVRSIADEAPEGLKFSACLPDLLARSVLQQPLTGHGGSGLSKSHCDVVMSIEPNGASSIRVGSYT